MTNILPHTCVRLILNHPIVRMAASSFVFLECLEPSAPTRSRDENQPGCSLTGDGVFGTSQHKC
jgi:hypothetical protein